MQNTKILEKQNNRRLNESVENGDYDFINRAVEQPIIQESKPRPTVAELSRRLREVTEKLTTNKLSFEINTEGLPDDLIKNLIGLRDQTLQAAKNNNKLVINRYLELFGNVVNSAPEILQQTKMNLINGLDEDTNKIFNN